MSFFYRQDLLGQERARQNLGKLLAHNRAPPELFFLVMQPALPKTEFGEPVLSKQMAIPQAMMDQALRPWGLIPRKAGSRAGLQSPRDGSSAEESAPFGRACFFGH